MNRYPYLDVLDNSLRLSKPFWELYDELIRNNVDISNQSDNTNDLSHERDTADIKYQEFIKVTREHQAKRERQKRLLQRKYPNNLETYYRDISQVDTLIEDNLVDTPARESAQSSIDKYKEEELQRLYGGSEAYEYIRSIEMSVDEYFLKKYQELKPKYWPVMPLNPRPYLNSIDR